MLPDLLKEGLDVVFVGTAASARSAAEGAYYAHPGNRFWSTLAEINLTPKRLKPSEFKSLLTFGIGLTDLCKTQAGADRAISNYDVTGLKRKIASYRPRAIAFTSKKAGSIWLGCPTDKRKPEGYEGAAIFILPSPSGAARGHWNISPWRELADWVRAVPR